MHGKRSLNVPHFVHENPATKLVREYSRISRGTKQAKFPRTFDQKSSKKTLI